MCTRPREATLREGLHGWVTNLSAWKKVPYTKEPRANKNVSTQPKSGNSAVSPYYRNSPNATLKFITVIPTGRRKNQEKDLVVIEEMQHLRGRNETFSKISLILSPYVFLCCSFFVNMHGRLPVHQRLFTCADLQDRWHYCYLVMRK